MVAAPPLDLVRVEHVTPPPALAAPTSPQPTLVAPSPPVPTRSAVAAGQQPSIAHTAAHQETPHYQTAQQEVLPHPTASYPVTAHQPAEPTASQRPVRRVARAYTPPVPVRTHGTVRPAQYAGGMVTGGCGMWTDAAAELAAATSAPWGHLSRKAVMAADMLSATTVAASATNNRSCLATPGRATLPIRTTVLSRTPSSIHRMPGPTLGRSIPIPKSRWAGGKYRWNGTTAGGTSTLRRSSVAYVMLAKSTRPRGGFFLCPRSAQTIRSPSTQPDSVGQATQADRTPIAHRDRKPPRGRRATDGVLANPAAVFTENLPQPEKSTSRAQINTIRVFVSGSASGWSVSPHSQLWDAAMRITTSVMLATSLVILALGGGCTSNLNLGIASVPIPVSPWWQEELEDRFWEHERYERVPIMGPVTSGGPPLALDASQR